MYNQVKVPIVDGRSVKEIELLASQLLKKCAPECLESPKATPIRKIFENDMQRLYGFTPLIQDMTPGLEGITDIVAKTTALAVHVYDGLEHDDPRCRFSGGHEIGHVVLHRHELALQGVSLVNGQTLRFARRSDIPAYADPEWQANVFAGALLMPKATVSLAVKGVHRAFRAQTVASTFKVSIEAATIRLRRLGLDA